jgi:hypothetical protein
MHSVTAGSDQLRPIRCPRCGYDQRGVVATWNETCPLNGVCSECGLHFGWCDVLVPERFEPQWCVEYASRLQGVPWAACKTFVRSFWPWGFWTRLQMSHRIRWLRLGMYGLLIPFLIILPLYVIGQTTLALRARSVIQQNLVQTTLNKPIMIQSLQQQKQNYLAHAARAGQSPQQIATTVQQIDAQIAQLQGAAFTPYVDSSALATTIEALIFPLAEESSASIVVGPGMTQPYLAPAYLLMYGGQLSSGPGIASDVMRLSLAWLAWGVGMSFLLPFSLALLPFSLRKAKVRWAHVVRVAAYGMIIPVLLLAVAGFTLGLAAYTSVATQPTSPLIRIVPWLAVALWWHAAISRYMKIPHAWLAVGLLTLMCLLVLLAITAAVSQPLAWEMMDLFAPLIR